MESEGYVYYMMLDDGVPAGFIGLVPHKEGKMFLSKLYVSAAHRSRGLPRAAFDFIETLCQAEKLPAIYLTVNKRIFTPSKSTNTSVFIKRTPSSPTSAAAS